ncbi:MAG: uroporphyrinogen-III synthase, partial [Flavobacteriales bacterium]|nr:uroporphyrinogen-III synthase [Flavobacteriales bacterium]
MKLKTILISQPAPTDEKSPYHELAHKHSLKIDFRAFINVEAVPAQEFRQERINILDHTAIILTSRNSVDHFFRMCKEMRITVPESMKYFCVSESVAYYVQKYIVYRKR